MRLGRIISDAATIPNGFATRAKVKELAAQAQSIGHVGTWIQWKVRQIWQPQSALGQPTFEASSQFRLTVCSPTMIGFVFFILEWLGNAAMANPPEASAELAPDEMTAAPAPTRSPEIKS